MSIENIKSALTYLNERIDTLEAQVSGYEEMVAGQQRDLFGKPIVSAANDSKVDVKKVTQKLDQAIDKVEKILKEG